MFANCESLISLPDLSLWNTSQVKFLNEMFFECKSLISFPEINLWNMSNVIEGERLFNGCNKSIIPNIDISSKLKDDSSLKTINYNQLQSMLYENNLQNLNYYFKLRKYLNKKYLLFIYLI